MNKNKVIYSLTVEDILNVIEENDLKVNLNKDTIRFIEDKLGDIIDWRGAIEFALIELEYKRKYSNG